MRLHSRRRLVTTAASVAALGTLGVMLLIPTGFISGQAHAPGPSKPGASKAKQDVGEDDTNDVDRLLSLWERRVRQHIATDPALKRLADRYPLVVLHSRALAPGGGYHQCAYSFLRRTADDKLHDGNVQLQFNNCAAPTWTFEVNTATDQQNLVADLGVVDFTKDPDPKKVDINGEGQNTWLPGSCRAINGHVYLERIKDSKGNKFFVLFKVVAVDKASRYMAFLWRRLPGGRVVERAHIPQ